ncbi:MAG: hypothetical protein K2V71_08260 [Methylotenera sp.]|nr:hypothetical protein [Methylotenera sp.]
MKNFFYIYFFVLSANGTAVAETESQPTKCYQQAWESRENGGLGLSIGQAITLCGGATNANKVIQCYVEAWGHPSNDGLGLTIGQAVSLCKSNLLE